VKGAFSILSDNPQVASGVREGDVLAGKYRIDQILGAGGMGVVVAAHHVALDEKVAIKFLLPDTLGNPEAIARFAREARAAVKIKSEHVAKVTDVGKLENGAPYMVMEYLDGGDLSGWLSQRGALPIEQAVEFVLQACEAIAQAHALGIIHRDLKPANLFVIRRPDGVLSVKVLDFGISKTTSLTGSGGSGSMTKTSALMGSPLYMSPEQMQSTKDVDARGDIWALGVILYELVAGVAPFAGETMPELIIQVMSAAPTPLRNKRPDAPEGFEAVILKCLDKDRGRRFQTVGELAVALLPFAPKRSRGSVERISGVMIAAGLAGSSLALPPSSDRTDEQPTTAGTAASWGRTTTGKSRGPWMTGGVAAVIVVGVIAMVLRKPATSDGAGSSNPLTPAAVVPTQPTQPTPATASPATEEPVAKRSKESAPTAPSPPAAVKSIGSPAVTTETKSPKIPHSNPVVTASPVGMPASVKPAAVTPTPAAAPSSVAHVAPPPVKMGNMYDDRK
jgi:serine/threonine-protein kinase